MHTALVSATNPKESRVKLDYQLGSTKVLRQRLMIIFDSADDLNLLQKFF